MHLLKKLTLMSLCLTGINIFGSIKETNDGSTKSSSIFTLRALDDASANEQISMITTLLENKELSDEKIAAMLEVTTPAVARARTYPGPKETEHLINLTIQRYHAHCCRHVFLNQILLPGIVLGSLVLLSSGWPLCYMEYEFNKRLQYRLNNLQNKKWFWQRA